MATNIIYKGEKVGTQVNFETGNLTDISTFTGDVRAAAIQDSIADGVTTIGASQDSIYAMSGYLAANAHPNVSAAADTGLALSNGNVIQDIDLAFDDLGHVETATFTSIDLDGRYYQRSEVQTISGALNTKITGNDDDILANANQIATNTGDIATNAADIATNTGDIATNAGNIATNAADIATNTGDIATNAGNIATNAADIATNTGDIATNAGNIATNAGNIATNASDIVSLETVSGNYLSLTLDDVCDNSAVTNQTITAAGLRVTGDGTSASITGPATITIDPDSAGPAGTVVIAGDLQVDGTTTTINSTSVQIDDLSLVLGTGAPNAAAADGGGIIIDGTGVANIAEFTFDGGNNHWKTNGVAIAADIVGNASTATAWVADSTITLGGDLGGSVTFNADASETLDATIANGAVEGKMLALDSVSGVHIADNEIDSEHYAVESIDNEHIADTTIQNDKLVNSSINITGGAGLAGGGSAELGGSAVYLSISAGHGLTANTDSLDINLDGITLSKSSSGLKVNSIGTSQIANDAVTSAKLDSSVAGDNITFTNGELSVADADITAGVQSDLGHLDEIELGSDNNSVSDLVTKGGVLILRGTGAHGITTGFTDGNAIDLNDKTTVAFEGVAQSTDISTNGDSDDGSYVAMWKIQGVIRRDSNSTNMLQSFVTNTFEGADAATAGYGLSISVDGNGLKINSNQSSESNLVTSATINYNWIEDTSA